jgi:hypothetical protein
MVTAPVGEVIIPNRDSGGDVGHGQVGPAVAVHVPQPVPDDGARYAPCRGGPIFMVSGCRTRGMATDTIFLPNGVSSGKRSIAWLKRRRIAVEHNPLQMPRGQDRLTAFRLRRLVEENVKQSNQMVEPVKGTVARSPAE